MMAMANANGKEANDTNGKGWWQTDGNDGDGKGRPANGDRTVVGGWWAPYITKAPTDSPPPLMSS